MPKKNRNTSSPDKPEDVATDANPRDEPRRDFLKTTVAAGVTLCALGTPLCAGARAVLAPVFQPSQAGKFYPLSSLGDLTEKPQKFDIVDDKRDAWTTLANQKIGSVFLRKVGDEVQAFHSLCPHAGCLIQVGTKKNPQTGNEEEMFYCPCHAAHFALDGKRLDGVSPRDLDTLETKIEDDRVAVKFENFIFGITEKRV